MILRMILFMFRRNWTSRLNSQAAQTAGSKVGAENEAKLGGEKIKRESIENESEVGTEHEG